jgi:hypothetical protein
MCYVLRPRLLSFNYGSSFAKSYVIYIRTINIKDLKRSAAPQNVYIHIKFVCRNLEIRDYENLSRHDTGFRNVPGNARLQCRHATSKLWLALPPSFKPNYAVVVRRRLLSGLGDRLCRLETLWGWTTEWFKWQKYCFSKDYSENRRIPCDGHQSYIIFIESLGFILFWSSTISKFSLKIFV